MKLSPDDVIFWQWGFVSISATLVFSWLVMFLLVLFSWLGTRKLSSSLTLTRGQSVLEAIVSFLREQIKDVSQENPDPYLAFIGTLFLYITLSNLLTIVPWYEPPTGSLSTTTALAIAVFLAVPFFGIRRKGLRAYLKQYIEPNIFMLPFNIIGELSRTASLAIRLFGNIMSGSVIVAILLAITPLFVPIVMQVFGLLIGVIQAYIFAILATVFIVSATADGKNEAQLN